MIINKLAETLKRKGATVSELRRNSGICLPTLYKTKNYREYIPRPWILSRICESLNVTISDLIEYIPDEAE